MKFLDFVLFVLVILMIFGAHPEITWEYDGVKHKIVLFEESK